MAVPTAAPDPDRQTALHSLYAGNHRWLLLTLRRRVGQRADAEDLAAETFLQVVDSPVDPASLQQPRAFLTTIAKRLLFHFRRRQALARDYLERMAQLPVSLAPSPEDQSLVLEAMAQVDRALHGLPLAVRSAFLYSQLEGLSHEAIAQRLGVSTRTVARYLVQALRQCVAATR